MRIICWLIFIITNFCILFVFTPKFERANVIKVFGALVPALIVLAVLVMLLMKMVGLRPDAHVKEIFFSTLMALVVLVMINLFNQLFFRMVDEVLAFHQKNNSANLGRQPLKFMIQNQMNIKRAATIIWFLGSTLMFYGIWLGDK